MKCLAPRLAAPLVALVALPGAARAQADSGEISLPIGELVSGLSYISLSQELSGATYVVDNGGAGADDTRFWVVKLPWETDLDVGAESGTLYLEAVAGYLQARDDLHIETGSGVAEVRTDWHSVGGLVGVGWTQRLDERWSVRPSISFALSHLVNDGSLNDVAQAEFGPEIDGVLVNWDAVALSSFASLAILHERDIGPVHTRLRARAAAVYTDIVASSARARVSDDVSGLLAVRGDFDGPTPLHAFGREVDWGAFASWNQLLAVDENALGFDRVFNVGLSIGLRPADGWPVLGLSGAFGFGPDIRGATLGLSASL